MNKFTIYIILFALISSIQVFGQKVGDKAKLLADYDSTYRVAPKEKLYIHIDKTTYSPLDTVWFKAYLIEANSNKYSTLSGLIHVEMINSSGSIVQSLVLPTNLGISWGSLVLNPKKYVNGTYTLRGYTNWMQNFGDTYFFQKQIKVLSIPLEDNTVNKNTVKVNLPPKSPAPVVRTPQDPSVQFLPEGGNWIEGRLQKVAFKAIAPSGRGVAVEGEIKDSKLRSLGTFKSNAKGMGSISFVAEPNELYTAFMKIGNRNYNQILQKPKNSGTSLIVNNSYNSDSLIITVFSDLVGQELSMIGQSRGMHCFSAIFPAGTKRKTVKVAKNVFPTGVGQILLQGNGMVLNERNFFINHKDQLKVNVSATSTTYANRENIPLQIKVTDAVNQPIGGSFSIAVTDNNQIAKDGMRDENILSYFLLSSDLKGEIEEPGYYFSEYNEQKHNDLDALCLTQGWVSYNWDLAQKPVHKAEKEYIISGRITNISNKPVPNAKVSIFGRNKVMMFGDTVSNEKGEFVFRNLPPMDSAKFVLKVVNAKGRLGTLGFEVDEFKQPSGKINAIKTVINDDVDSVELNFIANKQQEYKANPANGIALREVSIVGKRIIKGSKNLNGPGEADQTITAEELERANKKTLGQILQENVKGFNTNFRRKTLIKDYFLNFIRIKLVIDGIDVELACPLDGEALFNRFGGGPPPQQDMTMSTSRSIEESHYRHVKFYLDYYTAEDLEGIEIMRNPSYASNYKFEMDNVTSIEEIAYLEITTKTGNGPAMKKTPNVYLLKPMDYGDSRVFYHPKYTIANKTDKKPDFRSTIYWEPNLVTNANGEGKVSFFSADKKGSYTVWIEGSDMRGKFGMQTLQLTIK